MCRTMKYLAQHEKALPLSTATTYGESESQLAAGTSLWDVDTYQACV
jgi:hypothetical protein